MMHHQQKKIPQAGAENNVILAATGRFRLLMTGKISITAARRMEKDAMGRINLTATVAGER
ncbi:hypothetical protein D8L93_09480 [Sodalis-like symbiont of Bactericera trigonica]|nr:hypothetical protein D8L93_09480 [Sodalis-like symbiont of Bactericera trigonica]